MDRLTNTAAVCEISLVQFDVLVNVYSFLSRHLRYSPRHYYIPPLLAIRIIVLNRVEWYLAHGTSQMDIFILLSNLTATYLMCLNIVIIISQSNI